MDDESILTLATGRKNILENVLNTLKANLNSASIPQHLLIRGARGMGKSFFLKYLQVNFKREKIFSRAEFILLPEEQTNINSPADLLKMILSIAKNESIQSTAPVWDEGDGVWQYELERLKSHIESRRKEDSNYMMVVVLENLNDFIKSIESDKRKKKIYTSAFRHVLEKIEKFSFIGAIPQIDSDVDSDYNSRLFHAFKKCNLKSWDEEDYLNYFNRRKNVLEEKYNKTYSTKEVEVIEAKLKAISLYTGGSPRMAVVLTNLLLEDDVVSTANTLDGLIDDLTPYYQDLTKSIPKNSKILFDALIRHGENLSQSELAERVGATQSKISKAFAWLTENGYVIGKKKSDSPAYLYSVKDRIHVLYHMQREIHHNQAISPIWLLCDFLISIYSPEEIKIHAMHQLELESNQNADDLARVYLLSKGILGKEHLIGLNPLDGWGSVLVKNEKVDKIFNSIHSLEKNNDESCLKKLEELLGDFCSILVEINNKKILSSYLLSMLDYARMFYSAENKCYKSSRYLCQKALLLIEEKNIPKLLGLAHFRLGFSQFCLNEYNKAAESLNYCLEDSVIKSNPLSEVHLLELLGFIYYKKGQLENSIDFYTKANTILKQFESIKELASNCCFLGLLLAAINKNDKAIYYYKKAALLFKKLDDGLNEAECNKSIGDILKDSKKYAEAIEFYLKAKELFELEKDYDNLGTTSQKLGLCFLSLSKSEDSIKYLLQSNEYFSISKSDIEIGFNNFYISIAYLQEENKIKFLEFLNKSFEIFPIDYEIQIRELLFSLLIVHSQDTEIWDNLADIFLKKELNKLTVYKFFGLGIKLLNRKNEISKCFEAGNRMIQLIPDLFPKNVVKDALENLFYGLLKNRISTSLIYDLSDEALILFPEIENQFILQTVRSVLGYKDSNKEEAFLEKLNPDVAIAVKEIIDRLESDEQESILGF